MGPGHIAHTWVGGVRAHTGQRVVAVGSSLFERAREFAEHFDIPRVFGNYDDLLADSEIDAVYISTRQQAHRDNVLQAIAAGKHVLVEKPIATRSDHVREIAMAARSAGVLVMEALWTTYLPQSDIIRQLMANGDLGEVRLVQADFGQDLRHVERLYDIDGGGVGHDLGIYTVSFIGSVLPKQPSTISALGSLAESGVDEELAIRLTYADDASALAMSSMRSFTDTSAWIDGSKLALRVESPFFVPTSLKLVERELGGAVLDEWTDTTGIARHEGLSYQATAFASFLDQGLTESPWRNLDDSARDAGIIEEARHQIGAYLLGEKRD